MSELVVLKDMPEERFMVVQLGDTLDNRNIRELTTLLSRAVTDGYNRVIIDCSKLGFISSAGIGVIISKNSLFLSHNCELELYDVPEIIMFVLSELDVVDLLTIKRDLGTVISQG